MPDHSEWSIPIKLIAENHAEAYKDEFDGDAKQSLDEGTEPLFQSDEYEISDWASNNMNWDDVKEYATQVKEANDGDYQDGWCNGDYCID